MPGESPSLLPKALRWAGPLLAAGYGLGARVHCGITRPQRAPLPVLCIGNITVGGTGKTPATAYVARGLAAGGRKPAVLQRGYKNQSSDEAAEMRGALADLGIPVLLGGDRLASARQAHAQGRDVVVLDDGFQHWRLARDLDIVLIDATEPFGGEHLAPWGRLRESPAALSRAGAIIVTRADMLDTPELATLSATLRGYAPQAVHATAAHQPSALVDCVTGTRRSLSDLRGLRVFAVCGLGNPDGFYRTLAGAGATLAGRHSHGDHATYTPQTLRADAAEARRLGAAAIVVTEKDAVKLTSLAREIDVPVLSLRIAFQVLTGEAALWAAIDRALAPRRAGV